MKNAGFVATQWPSLRVNGSVNSQELSIELRIKTRFLIVVP